MEAHFSSLVGGDGLRERVLECLTEALAADQSRPVDVHIMTFSFTDARIAAFLKAAAESHPNVTIRIVADWGQGSRAAGRQVKALADCGLPNLLVRYKRDQPYQWDAEKGRLRWSYRTSRGLLHHKTLGIRIDGVPSKLVCGSFNWTGKAARSYENVLIVTAEDAESIELMRCIDREFAAMWCDGRVTLSPDEARAHYFKILEEYRVDPGKAPDAVVGLSDGQNATLPAVEWCDEATAEGTAAYRSAIRPLTDTSARLAIAFSSRSPHDTAGDSGYSLYNRNRRFDLYKPSGKLKEVPLTLAVLALDMIARATTGHTLKIAMYALSSRVPEYGALLDAARRGVRIQILIDREVGQSILARLRAVREREGLPIEIRAGQRMMHQKYIVHPETHTVLTGTANLSTDASLRHSEQRILIRENPAITERFLADFDTIWARLPLSL